MNASDLMLFGFSSCKWSILVKLFTYGDSQLLDEWNWQMECSDCVFHYACMSVCPCVLRWSSEVAQKRRLLLKKGRGVFSL